jgi:hypothetical protein
MADFRALCEQLMELAEGKRYDGSTVIAEARAALDQPEPERLIKAQLRQIFDDQSGFIDDEQVMWWPDFYKAAQILLATK